VQRPVYELLVGTKLFVSQAERAEGVSKPQLKTGHPSGLDHARAVAAATELLESLVGEARQLLNDAVSIGPFLRDETARCIALGCTLYVKLCRKRSCVERGTEKRAS
jgi:hypothetical protein